MAKVELKLLTDFEERLSRLREKTDEIIPRVLQAGGEVALDKVKSNLRSVIGRGTKYASRSTGELLEALGLSPAKLDRDGNHNVKVGFAEPREGGGSNARIANILEHGKSGQPAKPFLGPAKTASRKACIEAMITKLDEEIKNL